MDETLEIIAGKNPVLEALRKGRSINKIMFSKGTEEKSNQEIINLATAKGIPIEWVPRQLIVQKAETKAHQGIIAFASPISYVEIEDILALARAKQQDPFILLLDHLEDPHNLGAIIRTAEAAGVHGVIIPKRRGVSVNTTVAKTSAGAVEYVPVARVANLVQAMDKLKQNGCWIVGTDQDAREEFYNADLKGPLTVVVGSEGKGISRLVKENCDFTVKIPMVGKINSLNASVAASVIMYEVYRQREQALV
ncbi:MAG: 23S rRNA (guanosine(2251)-2'-O)-methyltransferase RlmB [Zhaonellaceae bacterium]|nr:23S rRNA (guanosine(2251)-2'-O)-methyltransferase RlmB [Clostridia bacterium]